MLKTIFFVLSILILQSKAFAQHCPMDGGYIIVIKLTDTLGQPVTAPLTTPCLIETGNLYADSCEYARGLLSLPFDIPQKNLVERHPGHWKNMAARLLEHSFFKEPGYFCVVLSQAEHACLYNNEKDFHSEKRKFEIRLINNAGTTTVYQVPPDRIYSLCTNSGTWNRMQPFEITLKE
jgi:hypothetical protein